MAHATTVETPFYGLMAEFETADGLLAASRKVRDAGFTKFEAYSPFPIHGLGEAVGFKEKLVSKLVLAGGITGLLVGAGLEYWSQVIAYPMNIGGRPHNSWPMYVPPAFETTILFAAIAAVFGMLALNGLPQPYHPVFNAPGFERASQDRFFLVVEAGDPKFDADGTRQMLSSLQPREVVEVAH
ncbi:MAG: DUF3341 domain-containing protein [Acidobacteriota bacterium]|nr:DUF3341 domain-containing protein [Acidobacteriota bacterium]